MVATHVCSRCLWPVRPMRGVMTNTAEPLPWVHDARLTAPRYRDRRSTPCPSVGLHKHARALPVADLHEPVIEAPDPSLLPLDPDMRAWFEAQPGYTQRRAIVTAEQLAGRLQITHQGALDMLVPLLRTFMEVPQ